MSTVCDTHGLICHHFRTFACTPPPTHTHTHTHAPTHTHTQALPSHSLSTSSSVPAQISYLSLSAPPCWLIQYYYMTLNGVAVGVYWKNREHTVQKQACPLGLAELFMPYTAIRIFHDFMDVLRFFIFWTVVSPTKITDLTYKWDLLVKTAVAHLVPDRTTAIVNAAASSS